MNKLILKKKKENRSGGPTESSGAHASCPDGGSWEWGPAHPGLSCPLWPAPPPPCLPVHMLLEKIHESNFDPKKGDFNAFAGAIIRRLAGPRIYEARKKAFADGHIWSDDISLDSPEGEKLKVIDRLLDDHDYSAEERHARLERIEKVHKVLETMPEEYRYVWKRLCEGVSQRQLAKELGYKSHAGFQQKYMWRFKAEFVKAGIRRIETKGGCVRQINVE